MAEFVKLLWFINSVDLIPEQRCVHALATDIMLTVISAKESDGQDDDN